MIVLKINLAKTIFVMASISWLVLLVADKLFLLPVVLTACLGPILVYTAFGALLVASAQNFEKQ